MGSIIYKRSVLGQVCEIFSQYHMKNSCSTIFKALNALYFETPWLHFNDFRSVQLEKHLYSQFNFFVNLPNWSIAGQTYYQNCNTKKISLKTEIS